MREAGYDPARLPPGQYLTAKWPVLHAGSVPRYNDLSQLRYRDTSGVREHIAAAYEASSRYLDDQGS